MDVVSDNSSFNCPLNHDVFLSFRGPDTRKIFAGHLYAALQRKAVPTFIDSEKLEKGASLEVLLEAIDISKLSIVVFSENYATSTWCLKELARIAEWMNKKTQIVVPIFYQVDPADVRYQKGSFEEAFVKHEQDGRETKEELRRWRSALKTIASISGWDSRGREDDSKLVEDIATDIFGKLKPVSKYDVFLSFHVDDAYPMFVSHLYAALKQKGISTFQHPEDLKKGNVLQQKAIDESGLSVVVFSNDYPWSKECLNELVQIMDCTDKRERIVIIFYRIKPSVVRDLEGSFQKAFVYHEERKRFKEMQKWRSALATACSLPCWETEKSKDNAKLIENICMRIYENLIKIRSKTIQST